MSDPFIAQITLFAGNFPPRGWAFCDGQILPINTNTALFSLVGTTYGGDGQSTFGLPDLRGRVPMHVGDSGQGPGGVNVNLGQKSGAENTTLVENNLPSHTHVPTVTNTLEIAVQTGTQNSDDPDQAVLAAGPNIYSDLAADATMGTGSIAGDVTVSNANTGNGQAFSRLQPYTGVNFIIALIGTFPSQNFSGFGKGRDK